jgi:hypothetical protein
MCPACLSSVARLITGGVSVLGASAGAVAIVRNVKISKVFSRGLQSLAAKQRIGTGVTNEN